MVTVVELAAYLGVTPGYVRQVIAEHGVRPAGRRGQTFLYRPADVLRHTGHHDRRSSQSADLR